MQWDVRRNGTPLSLMVTPHVDEVEGQRVARVGITFGDYEHVYVREEPLSVAAPRSAVETWQPGDRLAAHVRPDGHRPGDR